MEGGHHLQVCNNIKKIKLIEVQCYVLLLSVLGVKLDVKMREKETLEYGRMHVFEQ